MSPAIKVVLPVNTRSCLRVTILRESISTANAFISSSLPCVRLATVPFRNVQQIRIQHGSDLTEVSDGVAIQVNDAPAIRNRLGEELTVGLPPELLNEIAPGVPQPMEEPPDASLALYLQFSCHNQNKVLYATSGTITFDALFSGDPNESVGAEKLTDARFSVTVADPRSALPGTLEYPDEATSPLEGWFRFHFQRGQPGQPFP